MSNILRGVPLYERHAAKTIRCAPDECWPWNAHRSKKNFGMIGWKGSSIAAHRVAYAIAQGYATPDEIPRDIVVDHICHGRDQSCNGGNKCEHRACQNPDHLEGISTGENTLRGRSFATINAAKTHCPYGHSLDDAYQVHRNSRQCRPCTLERTRLRHMQTR
jgi:hypothetical protein